MPNLNYVQGKYGVSEFNAMGEVGDDGLIYFKYKGMDLRTNPLATLPDDSAYTWVERNYGYEKRQFWRLINGFQISALNFNPVGGSGATGNNAMAENAVLWAIDIANDDSHGYDWDTRNGGVDYDCSSLVNTAFNQAGFNVDPTWTTWDMKAGYTAIGFTWLGSEIANNVTQLQRGDILLHEVYHTAIYIGNGQMVAAHINEVGDVRNGQPGDQTGEEICVSEYSIYTYPSMGVYGWQGVLRPPSDVVGTGEWHENCTFTSYEIGGVAGWTGTPIEADSMGVAVPWNHGSVPPNPEFPDLYYGQLLQIEVGNFSGVVLVNDCGNFGDQNDYNHDAVLDLQPGVWAAAGGGMTTYTGCRWRVVGHTPTDNTNGKGPWFVV